MSSSVKTQVKFQVIGGSIVSSSQLGSESDQKASLYQTNSDYHLVISPPFKQISDMVRLSIDETEQLVFNNRKLIENLTKVTQLFMGGQGSSTKG